MQNAIELRHITKTFGNVVANKDVFLTVRRGEILSLLGENGSGKTTLMNMIAGIYYPDSGEIQVDEKPAEIRSPKDAYALGIGMVHQHFKLIDVFTAVENIALVMDQHEKYDLKAIRQKAREICDRYAFDIDLDQKVYEMSVSQKQTLEIIKMLYRGAQILILDEPTAVLTPQEGRRQGGYHHHPQAARGAGDFRPSGHPAQGRIRRHGGNRRRKRGVADRNDGRQKG